MKKRIIRKKERKKSPLQTCNQSNRKKTQEKEKTLRNEEKNKSEFQTKQSGNG